MNDTEFVNRGSGVQIPPSAFFFLVLFRYRRDLGQLYDLPILADELLAGEVVDPYPKVGLRGLEANRTRQPKLLE
jgi:hypothetical protein